MNTKEQFALALRIIGVLGLIYIVRTFVRTTMPPAGILIARAGLRRHRGLFHSRRVFACGVRLPRGGGEIT